MRNKCIAGYSIFLPLQFDLNQLMMAMNVSQGASPSHKPLDALGLVVEHSPLDRTKGFFTDESEPLLRCDSTSSKDSALSRTGSFITKGKRALSITLKTFKEATADWLKCFRASMIRTLVFFNFR